MPKTEIPREAEGTSSSVTIANMQAQGKPLGSTYAADQEQIAAIRQLIKAGDQASTAVAALRTILRSIVATLAHVIQHRPSENADLSFVITAHHLAKHGIWFADEAQCALDQAVEDVALPEIDGGAQ